MEDRRAAYPTKDTPDMPPDAGRSAIDSPAMRAENDSIHNVHRRYWMLLVIGVVCVGLYSFYAPVSMTSALHCANGQNVSFSYLILEEDCISAGATLACGSVICQDDPDDSALAECEALGKALQ